MHILFICNELPPAPHGGIGIFVKTLSKSLVEKGHKVSVAGYDETVSMNQVAEEEGVMVHRLPDRYADQKKRLIFGRYALDSSFYFKRKELSAYVRDLVRREKIDLVESYDWSGPLWFHPRVPLIVRMHGAYVASQWQENKRPSRLIAYCEKKNVKMADHLVAVSEHIGGITNKALNLNKPFTVIPNAVNTDVFLPNNEVRRNPDKLVYVGRIHRRKGLFELFKALVPIMEQDKALHLEIYGRGDDKTIQSLLQSVPESTREQFNFKGYIAHEQLSDVYSSAGCVVCPSRAEAFGLSAVEAMACGCPVLMTRETSGPELIRPGFNGELASLSGSDLETVLENLIAGVKEGRYVPDQIRQHVIDHYSLNKVIEENMAFYLQAAHQTYA